MSLYSLIEEIKNSLDAHIQCARFVCGGRIPIKNTSTQTTTTLKSFFYVQPIQLCFGSNGLGDSLNVS